MRIVDLLKKEAVVLDHGNIIRDAERGGYFR